MFTIGKLHLHFSFSHRLFILSLLKCSCSRFNGGTQDVLLLHSKDCPEHVQTPLLHHTCGWNRMSQNMLWPSFSSDSQWTRHSCEKRAIVSESANLSVCTELKLKCSGSGTQKTRFWVSLDRIFSCWCLVLLCLKFYCMLLTHFLGSYQQLESLCDYHHHK